MKNIIYIKKGGLGGIFLFLASCFLLLASQAFSMSQEERVQDAQSIINLFTQQYGPLPWKEANIGLNFNKEAEKFIEEAKAAVSDKDFYIAVAGFISKFKDAHVSYQIPSSFKSYLPFETEYFKDGVVITWVNESEFCNKKSAERCETPIKAGDKVTAIDGAPVEKIIDLLLSYLENGYSPTNRKIIGTIFLTYRPQEIFPEPPTGATTLTIEQKDGSVKDVLLEWTTSGFDLAEMPPKSAFSYMAKAMIPAPQNMPPAQEAKPQTFIEKFNDSHHVNLSGNIFGISPQFKLWENFEVRMKSPYYTGTFTAGGRKIGYIRINSWKGLPLDPRILQLEKEIEYLNNNTDALVLDQTNNGGGNSCYMYRIASFFITEPKDAIKFQVRANRTWLSWLEQDYQYASEDQKLHAKAWLDGLRDAVLSGEYLSKPLPDCSLTGKIFPYRNMEGFNVLYVKPALVLVNELDFSAADMFPAVMQDWNAAVLFGARTAGAGGNVIEAWPIGNSELSIWLTQSLMYRNSEVPLEGYGTTHYVENVGVTPEISYEITAKDYYSDYRPYREAIENAIMSILK